jgi:hypothetical protein
MLEKASANYRVPHHKARGGNEAQKTLLLSQCGKKLVFLLLG